MNKKQAAYLQNCNGIGHTTGHTSWLPYERRGDDYYTPGGLKAEPPTEWREMSSLEVIAYMDSMGLVPVMA